jgi:hypothetical protein
MLHLTRTTCRSHAKCSIKQQYTIIVHDWNHSLLQNIPTERGQGGFRLGVTGFKQAAVQPSKSCMELLHKKSIYPIDAFLVAISSHVMTKLKWLQLHPGLF